MTTQHALLPRAAWTTHGPARALTGFAPGDVLGVALHWPGTTGVIGDPGSKAVAGRLEGYRSFHAGLTSEGGRGWADIAYNVAADQAGRLWSARGLAWRSAANGSAELNRTWVAVLLLVGPGEQPTPALVASLRWLRTALVLPAHPKATRVVGHGDIRPRGTACPGPAVAALIRSGQLTKAAPKPAPKPAPGHPYTLRRVLRLGVTGSDVEQLQKRLNRDLPDIRVDGDFGPVTDRTVRVWQSTHGLTADGRVGPNTAAALGWAFLVRRRAA